MVQAISFLWGLTLSICGRDKETTKKSTLNNIVCPGVISYCFLFIFDRDEIGDPYNAFVVVLVLYRVTSTMLKIKAIIANNDNTDINQLIIR